MASHSSGNKLRVLLIPYLATSHIEPFTELAISLAAASDAVEATLAVTPANVSVVQSLLDRGQHSAVKIATYPFSMVEGIPNGVENLGKVATPEESLRFRSVTLNDALTRPVQEALIRAQSPDAIVTDILFLWNGGIAEALGVPCVAFSVMGAFSMLAVRHLMDIATIDNDDNEVPRFPAPPIRIPRSELPDFLRRQDYSFMRSMYSLQADCFGLVTNTSSELEKQYCEMFVREGYVKRAYFVGPLALRPPQVMERQATEVNGQDIMDWLDSKPNCSVVYVSFGSMAHTKDAQLDELAHGLETSGTSFLWVIRGKEEWSPPKGWEERVQDRGFIIRVWAPQRAILGHPATGAFVTQCGWNSILETVAAGVPVLTWPVFFEQFITERQVTEVLRIGERLWPHGVGLRSESYQEHEVIPGQDVARALTTFMKRGGSGDMARARLIDLSAKVHAAVAEGGTSLRDLHRLIQDLMAADRN